MTNPTLDAAIATATEWRTMTARIKEVIVRRLDLPIPGDWITDDQPLFGRGLELDSLDALELSMAVDQEFNTPMYEESTAMLGSVSAFLDHMLAKANQETTGANIPESLAVLGEALTKFHEENSQR
jgi:acyl carrier protein